MATIGSYYVRVLPDMSGFNAPLVRTLGSTMGRAGDNAGSMFSRSFLGFVSRVAIGTTIGRLVTNGFNTIVNGFSSGIERLDIVENYPRIMENLGVANDDAQRSIERLQEALFGLPTSLQDGITATQRLTSALGDVDQGTDAFIAFNNALVAGMASPALQQAALEQFVQAIAKGKPDMLEWRSMLNAMPGQMAQIASSFGLTTNELGEGLRNGTISMDEFLDALILLNEEGADGFASFEEQARTATNTIGTALTNVNNRVAKGWASILDVFGQSNIADFINNFSNGLLAGFESIAAALQWLVDLLGSTSIGSSLETIGAAIGEFLEPLGSTALTTIQEFATGAIQLLDDALAGLSDVLSNIDFSTITDFISGSGEAFSGMVERIQQHLSDLQPHIDNIGRLWGIFADSFSTFVEAVAPLVAEFLANLVSGFVGLAPIVAQIAEGFLMFGSILLDIATIVISTVVPFVADLIAAVVGLVSVIITTVVAFASNIVSIASNIVAHVVAFFASLPGRLLNIWNNIKSAAINAWNNLKSSVSNSVSGTTSNVVSKFMNLRSRVVEIWNNIKTAITTPINAARDAVKNAIDKIKGFFNFSVSWPHIPLPHFGISPSGWVIGDLLKGVLPSLSISWYAKGGIINGATLYGVGEKGAELVWPSYEPYLSRYAAAIADNMSGGSTINNYYIDGSLVAADAQLAAALDVVAQRVSTRQRMGSVR